MDTQRTIVQVFDEACNKYADNPAYTALGYTLTFKDLDRLSGQFAAYLQNKTDLKPGDRLAIQLPNLLQYPIAAFGALRAGLVIVNTNPLYTQDELKHQLTDSGARALVVLENFADTASKILKETSVEVVITSQVGDINHGWKRFLVNTVLKLKGDVPSFSIPGRLRLPDLLEQGEKYGRTPVDTKPEDLAVLQYTGGTTGVAKGAMLSHANLVANTCQIHQHLPEIFREGQEIYGAPLPLYHIYAFTMHLLCSLASGNHSVLIPNPRDIGSIVKVFKAHPITAFIGLNTLYNAMLENSDFNKLDFSHLRYCVAGGMAMTLDTSKRWQKLTGCEISEGYGLTETSPVVSSNQYQKTKMGTIGTVVPGTQVKVLKEGDDESGELLVKGPQVMMGYWQRPDETEKVLTEDGWLHTGDVAIIGEDGYLRIVDRIKDMIIVSGFKVFPNEVEDVISSHPGIVECAAIGVEDEHSGEVVKIFVVPKDPGLTVDDIEEFCRDKFTGYKIPKYIEIRSELPKSNVGKILRRVLKEENEDNTKNNTPGK